MRQTKLTEKDMTALRDTESAKNQVKQPFAVIKEYSGNHKVSMEWDLNEEAKRDMIFILKVDNDTELYLDWEEMMKAGRFI